MCLLCIIQLHLGLCYVCHLSTRVFVSEKGRDRKAAADVVVCAYLCM